jgi:hypothetical protein
VVLFQARLAGESQGPRCFWSGVYLLQTGKVEAARLFLAENQTGGVRSDGSRAYLEFR